jgi:hypothetical protein
MNGGVTRSCFYGWQKCEVRPQSKTELFAHNHNGVRDVNTQYAAFLALGIVCLMQQPTFGQGTYPKTRPNESATIVPTTNVPWCIADVRSELYFEQGLPGFSYGTCVMDRHVWGETRVRVTEQTPVNLYSILNDAYDSDADNHSSLPKETRVFEYLTRPRH